MCATPRYFLLPEPCKTLTYWTACPSSGGAVSRSRIGSGTEGLAARGRGHAPHGSRGLKGAPAGAGRLGDLVVQLGLNCFEAQPQCVLVAFGIVDLRLGIGMRPQSMAQTAPHSSRRPFGPAPVLAIDRPKD